MLVGSHGNVRMEPPGLAVVAAGVSSCGRGPLVTTNTRHHQHCGVRQETCSEPPCWPWPAASRVTPRRPTSSSSPGPRLSRILVSTLAGVLWNLESTLYSSTREICQPGLQSWEWQGLSNCLDEEEWWRGHSTSVHWKKPHYEEHGKVQLEVKTFL